MKKNIILLTTAICLVLTGCSTHEHTWEDATCVEPKTCSECGETDGDALGHDWEDATCSTPKTCKVCGETEGDVLEHTWEEATCSAPKTCSVCGETEGDALEHEILTEANYQSGAICGLCGEEVSEPLTPDFETYGLTDCTFVEVGQTYDYYTCGYEDTSYTVTADATILSYERGVDVEGYDCEEGYEWVAVNWEVYYYGDNAWNYGFMTGIDFENYYDIQYHDDSAVHDEETGIATYSVMINGEEYECKYLVTSEPSEWDTSSQTYTFNYTQYLYMPEGYDGFVVGLYNKTMTWEEGMYIYDLVDGNNLFFRLA